MYGTILWQTAYCPTENMLGDFFTKPLQGSVFKNMHKIILNMPNDANDNIGHRSVLGIDKSTVSRNERSNENAKKAPAEENRALIFDMGWKKNETKCDFHMGWKLFIILILLDYVN